MFSSSAKTFYFLACLLFAWTSNNLKSLELFFLLVPSNFLITESEVFDFPLVELKEHFLFSWINSCLIWLSRILNNCLRFWLLYLSTHFVDVMQVLSGDLIEQHSYFYEYFFVANYTYESSSILSLEIKFESNSLSASPLIYLFAKDICS